MQVNAFTCICIFTQVVSRAPTRESLRCGKPQPAIHCILPLPFQHSSISPLTFLETQTSQAQGGKENCIVIAGDGCRFVGYNVQASFSFKSATEIENEILNYEFYTLFDVNLFMLADRSLITYVSGTPGSPVKGAVIGGMQSEGKGEHGSEFMVLPVSSVNILTTRDGTYNVSFIVLDAVGGAWLIDTKGTYMYTYIYMYIDIYNLYIYIYTYTCLFIRL
jgi:hypothetical protein